VKVWTTVDEADRALDALQNAKKVLTEEEYKKLREEMIQIALKSYPNVKFYFFAYLPDE